ncbi:LRR receptor-like serine/threonine-protein kinase IOS1 [Morus notabilis]|uniref:LRR receptor-like serine/threonine-protein kinase IOS1 n=1 Tax=Morus notabilis TaxID=981085 RepID=UPI000CED5C4F|nr:LRR receptor-like serine/threonine-protein kinase IOS1 [Morus notabilis]
MDSMRVTGRSKHSFLFVFLVVFALVHIVHAQDQTDFISLDCGRPDNSSYSEKSTTINYISDAAFIDTGVSKTILPKYRANLQQQITYLRSFPEGIRNCYKISVEKGTKYLIRTTFFYGDYDGQNKTPRFDLHIGANFWDAVKFDSVSSGVVKEIIHTPPRNYVHVCLVNTGFGTPFIQALELRPLKNTTYMIGDSHALSLFARFDPGSTTNSSYRYPYDGYDRIWIPFYDNAWTELTSSLTVDPETHIDYWPPSIVMSTAATPKDESGNSIEFHIEPPNESDRYYLYIHFAELRRLESDDYRAFNINVNGRLLYGPVVPDYLSSTTIYSTKPITGESNYSFSIDKLENSTLPPILNAIEFYTLLDFSLSETQQDDVEAITSIKSTYGVERNWDGDPCVPIGYLWSGLNCTNDVFDPPRIMSLDLSSRGLTGNITEHISKLSMLESLDLSNNSLTGSVPEFLSSLQYLKVLNLGRNKLTGSIPTKLIERSRSGSLSLSYEDNLDLCASSPCKKKKKSNNNILIPIAASVGGLVILISIAATILVTLRKKKKPGVTVNAESNVINWNDSILESRKRQFTYAEIIKMTNNFERILGKGGFGTVYHGCLDDNSTQVAVKMLSPSSLQGYQQFQAEVKLLMRVHHRNLTSLIGHCNEGTNMALIYEYMANGNLDSHLSGASNGKVLGWEGRLKISIDAAQGLEYLHNGCKPPIVHRDVKTTNILLTENFQAKLADFGLSKSFPTDDGTHMSTIVAGTPGYLDPEYYMTNRLNEKSDVYSFGIVLLEMITSRPAIRRTHDHDERTHISQWVSFMLANGDIKSIVDPRLNGDFEVNSVWKAVEISMACVSVSSTKRPTMTQVVTELNESLAIELARRNNSRLTDSTNSTDILSINMTTELSPMAR